jgi:ATP-dependent helicase/nuclease subunit B
VQARFLLGPAGSGKTFRCVGEVRAELLCQPEGAPLIFVAPKQATFQIERQLLGEGGLKGYSRLHILSFERLAEFIFGRLNLPVPELLGEEGRVMVLRALLARHHGELKIFRASARLAGFASQLSLLLREFQRCRVTPERLASLAASAPRSGRLNDKLNDLALVLARYSDWLGVRRETGRPLDDANRLLDLAVEAVAAATTAGSRLEVGGLWLDGFAEMTPQEQALLAILIPHCEKATLAFCLEGEPGASASWLSPWGLVGRTFAQCRERLAKAPDCNVTIEMIGRELPLGRFSAAPELARLECDFVASRTNGESQAVSSPDRRDPHSSPAIRLVACPDAEAEAVVAARAILRHVQESGRFRDCAVLVRSLEGYHDVLRRVFSRYQIPFFLDRRESVAHHPLAELTRYALRTVAFDWKREDWFGALKTGFAMLFDEEVDCLENEALRRGWEGRIWHAPFVLEDPAVAEPLEGYRRRVMPPFEALEAALKAADFQPSGRVLAAAVRQLWQALAVEAELDRWSKTAGELGVKRAEHDTVWSQLNDWVDHLDLAFGDESQPLRDWLPVLEAGLAGLTVGVIPPSLDQVMIGSVDRSRNPDLQIAFVLGVNEGVFPAPPEPGVLLTEADRLEIETQGILLGLGQRHQIGRERYFGYIAFTRASRQLAVTWSRADADGRELNPSPFVSVIRQALPDLVVEEYRGVEWAEALHSAELVPHVLGSSGVPQVIAAGEDLAPLVRAQQQAVGALKSTQLDSAVAARLFGTKLITSVSALEDFTACPFHYFVARSLRAQERDEFVVDARQRGSFQHEVLDRFHREVRREQREWRDLTPADAREQIRRIGEAVAREFGGGLFASNEQARFMAGEMVSSLERLMETLVGWMGQYRFNPTAVEVSFGLQEAQLPPWRIELSNGRALSLRGRIDRVDLCRTGANEALLVICDYKSGGKEMKNDRLANGLELQLLSYLAALAQMPEAGVLFGVDRLQPAGVFYVPLRGRTGSGATRAEAEEAAAEASAAYQHRGRFDGQQLAQFDSRRVAKGDQFRYSLKADGGFAARGNEALPLGEFPGLVEHIVATLRETGERIFSGEACVSPYRLKIDTACDLCAFRPVCRFDPWIMAFRRLDTAKGGGGSCY